ncbi:indole-3-glycerol phosphate synthase TrpC [Tellurirhabdus rosea]|uniref:indole-3-glycerol phosphate synthase TrpC n=1 Tax=Tellurirhabdus rosea TaxID=2674997 RepID=UPI002259CAF4|nr:indole-3-glycerol phosphate synthase TrpC [Tellurirhabdus rosea]
MNILETIIASKQDEVARRKSATSVQELEQQPLFSRQPLSARQALTSPTSTGIIAEFKRKSPSKGIINDSVSVAETTTGYVRSGAACLSVLTDEPFFGGTPADLLEARAANSQTPIIRKDFIVDPYQITEARALGADFILLIASCLSPAQVGEFSQFAHELGLEVLLEIHDETELVHIQPGVDLVGVNNRNLKTFVTDIDTSLRLAGQIPANYVKVSESGLQKAESIHLLRQAGYQGFLIGETFMKAASPAEALQTFVNELSFPSNFPSLNTVYHESESMRNA